MRPKCSQGLTAVHPEQRFLLQFQSCRGAADNLPVTLHLVKLAEELEEFGNCFPKDSKLKICFLFFFFFFNFRLARKIYIAESLDKCE